MRRFTVSLDDGAYQRLRDAADRRTPPATLQQMIRHAVEALVGESPMSGDGDARPGDEPAGTGPVGVPAQGTERLVPPDRDVSTFRVGGVWFGLPVDDVEGIISRVAVDPLPTAGTGVLGVARYREGLITVLDGGELLGTGPLSSEASHSLVLHLAGGLVALAVDEVGSLVAAGVGRRHPVPPGAGLAGANRPVALLDTGDVVVNVLDGFTID